MSMINYVLNDKNFVALEMFLTSTAKIVSEKKMQEIKAFVKSKKMTLEDFFYQI